MFVVDDGVVRLRVVQVGERQNEMVRVIAGLDAGAVVATSGVDRLIDGARVTVSPEGK